MPRNGGIGIHAGIFLAWATVAPPLPSMIWLSLVPLLLVSFLDDVRGVPVVGRLTTHLLAAGAAAASLFFREFGLAGVIIAALSMVWMTNLYNFMDGSDGLAGGMALFGFSFYGVAALLAGNVSFALLNLSIAAAAAGFLVLNFYPARIFMGDMGSVPLGFLAAALGLIGWTQGQWALWFPMLVFSPFIVDASVTLTRRILRRERVWLAHRDHYYQRLVQMGWGHRNTALAEYGLMAVCGLSALAGLFLPVGGQIALIGAQTLTYVAIVLMIERAWRRHLAARQL